MRCGTLPVGSACHSKKLSASTRQRRRASNWRKLGFSVSVSARALMGLGPPAKSRLQLGTRPQDTSWMRPGAALVTMGNCCEGAAL